MWRVRWEPRFSGGGLGELSDISPGLVAGAGTGQAGARESVAARWRRGHRQDHNLITDWIGGSGT